MDEQKEGLEGKIVSGNFEVSCNMTFAHNLVPARQFRITGIIFSDDTREKVLERVAVAQDVVDMQFVRADVIAKEAMKAHDAMNIQGIQQQAADLLDKQKKGKKLTGAELQSLRNSDTNMLAARQRIASLDAAIAAARAKLNGTAPA